jgi:hypothetical protein
MQPSVLREDQQRDGAMAGTDLFYFAARARQERQLADSAKDERASRAHRSLGMSYALRAMELAILDARLDRPQA